MNITALETLLRALEEPDSCFVLGAGASSPIVPLAIQVGPRVVERLLTTGSFPATPIARDPISSRILPAERFDEFSDIQSELVARHLSPAAVQAATIELLRPEAPSTAPTQYAVFGVSRHPLSIVNFNNDGLATQYCRRHFVVNVHGTSLGADLRATWDWGSLIDTLQEYPDMPPPHIPGLLLPQREPRDIAETPEYRAARIALQTARRLIIVGYSFGEMDDWVAYTMITSTIRTRCVQTVVAKPDAFTLAGRLTEDSGGGAVMPLSAYWDKLSDAIIASVTQQRRKNCDHARLCASCTAYLYEAFLDGRRANRVGLHDC